jgi:hypothetical protein
LYKYISPILGEDSDNEEGDDIESDENLEKQKEFNSKLLYSFEECVSFGIV